MRHLQSLEERKGSLSRHGYWDIGYLQGRISALEEWLDKILEDYEAGLIFNHEIPAMLREATTIRETTPRSMALRVAVTTDDFDNIEVAHANGWYRKHYYCPFCNSELKTETFEHDHCFGSWCAVSEKVPMHHCPNCGTKISNGE